ncbi:cytochrome c oxidase assembly protein subunit 15 [Belliella buryatensis]|uniref:Cytochrome c oxidase assembly protein subunit 15 n=1 Tax=Belliella buryatensis TaxID=1500549 RepID=A0A239FFV5_9BACT|nr:COX15/CtaA family protein [Belliella buryatensis]SNS55809.1 cytochrome c oxidase assembly protein subunit 15 [Belliella buryatensis]
MNLRNLKSINSFRRISLITVIAVYFLILVGGIVRSTGSGMGCPDWPKCFGSWVPPTSVNQLPNDYQEIYLEKRVEKNDRFVASLEKLGFTNKAEEIRNDKSILIEEEFNATKTWIEYINRLIGVVIGLLIILTVYRSLSLWSQDKLIPILSIGSLILVLFIGWIGSIVVSTNLLTWMITIHMLLALLLVCILIYIHFRAHHIGKEIKRRTYKSKRLSIILFIGFILMIVQIILGTQVREEIDQVATAMGNLLRSTWIEQLGLPFLIHRSYSLVLLGIHLLFIYKIYKYSLRNSGIFKLSQLLLIIIVFEILTGVGMAYFAIPAFLQPVHLLLGALIIGIQFLLLLNLFDQNKLKIDTVSS